MRSFPGDFAESVRGEQQESAKNDGCKSCEHRMRTHQEEKKTGVRG